jgi:hypothetical protein
MMSITRFALYPLALAGVFATSPVAEAGWNNVFLVSCNDCSPPARRSSSPPAPQRDVQYEQRCYYEPVKVMRPERFVEEVPVQVKSYYWDPVTSYSYRSYYDPCSGDCQQIAVPRTSYVRKEKCETVMKAVERVRMVPVEVSRKVCETRPVVTYYGPTTRTYGPIESTPPAGSSNPRIDELRPAPSVMPPERSSGDRIIPPGLPITPMEMASPKIGPAVTTMPKVNAFSTARSTSSKTSIHGEVVGQDQQTPRSGAKLVFVSATDHNVREYATADEFGGFDLKLPAGDWHMYVGSGNGQASYHKKITVTDGESRNFTVVSRN